MFISFVVVVVLHTIHVYAHSYSVPANLVLDSEEEAISELNLFKQAGGVSLCDVTCTGIRNNVAALPRLLHPPYTVHTRPCTYTHINYISLIPQDFPQDRGEHHSRHWVLCGVLHPRGSKENDSESGECGLPHLDILHM